jgi:nitrite reductase (NADH) small subunit
MDAVIAIDLDGKELVLGLDAEGYFAMQRRCPHRGADLGGAMVSRGHVICPQHGWRFSTASGRTSVPSEYCAVRYDVRVLGDQIEIKL